jgi:hypothetical protein
MKVGRGFPGPMSKSYGNCTSHGHSSFLYAAALIALGLILTSCGDISLSQLLENQEPGELSISPTDAYIPASGTLDISGKGGFKPYMYQNKGTLGSVDPQTGEYTAPSSVAGDYETTDIEVSDSFGTTASTTITVFTPIELSPAVKTIYVGQEVDFDASGGVPDPNYDFYVDGIFVDTTPGGWSHVFPTEGSYMVEVMDSLGSTAISTITVDGSMAIGAERNWVVKGNDPDTDPFHSTILTAINQTSPHIFSTEPLVPPSEVGWLVVDSFSPYFPYTYDETAIYHAPESEAVVTIQLTDWVGNIATVDIHVLSALPEPLVFPTAVTVLINEVVQLTASGGIEPHTFSLVGPGALSPHPVQEYRIRYHAPDFPTTAFIWVEDALGRQVKATVYVVEGG